jgi:hypothetical protein
MMMDRYVPLYIREKDRVPFLACLGLGTLYAIRDGTLSASAGIWTLGAPRMWKQLEGEPGMMAEIVAIFSAADELSAIQEVIPDEFAPAIDDFIHRLKAILVSTGEQYWIASWSPQEEDDKPAHNAQN